MSWVSINTARNAQDAPISADWGNDVVGDLNYLFSNSSNTVDACGAPVVPNGSFELDANNSTTVTSWTVVLGSGATGIVTNADQNHGAQSFKFTRDTTGGHSGGSLTSAFMNVSPSDAYQIQFMLKCSEADVENTVQITWYTSSQSVISTTTVYDSGVGSNAPTTWTMFSYLVTPPATAMYAKIILNAGIAAQTPAGTTSIYWDGIAMAPRPPFATSVIYTTTTTLTVPSGVMQFEAMLLESSSLTGPTVRAIFPITQCKPGDSVVFTFTTTQLSSVKLNGVAVTAIFGSANVVVPVSSKAAANTSVLVRY